MTDRPESGFPGSGSAGHLADPRPARRSVFALALLGLASLLVFAGLLALGTWQVHRLHWKLDLIARVDRRVHAAPVPAPGPARWPQVTAESDEYRRVTAAGRFLYPKTTRVQASTALGSGYWLLTPLQRDDGSIVLVNRGFVPAEQDGAAGAEQGVAGELAVTGLLRISEPRGAFLRHNDPAAGRWYSRDVAAIAAARGLRNVAPYFIDAAADANGNRPGQRYPVGGLTVIAFPNNHLVYALTWYGLAVMVAAGVFWVIRDERRRRRGNASGGIDSEGADDREQ